MGLYFVALWLPCLKSLHISQHENKFSGLLDSKVQGFPCLLLGPYAVFGSPGTWFTVQGSSIAFLWLCNLWVFSLWLRTTTGKTDLPKDPFYRFGSNVPLIAWILPGVVLGIFCFYGELVPLAGAFLWLASIGFGAEAAWYSSHDGTRFQPLARSVSASE